MAACETERRAYSEATIALRRIKQEEEEELERAQPGEEYLIKSRYRPLVLEAERRVSQTHAILVECEAGAAPIPLTYSRVPVSIRVFSSTGPGYTTKPTRIDFGSIPPNFHHTCVFDVHLSEPTPNNIDNFYIEPGDGHLDDNGDAVTISKANGEPVAVFTSVAAFWNTLISCSFVQSKRLYITLTTSAKIMDRRLCILGIRIAREKSPADEFVYMQDDINYDAGGDTFVEKWREIGTFQAPWTERHLGVIYTPHVADGWHLLARNTTDPDPGFMSLVYYNEQTSRLRVYLYRFEMPATATGYLLEMSLIGPDGELHGAFFPVHGDSSRWNKAILPVPDWPVKEWTMVELPILYPMCEGPAEGSYVPLYEDRPPTGNINVWVKITLKAYLSLTVTGSIIGQAIGHAVQEIGGDNEFLKILYAIGSGISTGLSVYSGVTEFSKKVQEYLDKKHKADELMDAFAKNFLDDLAEGASSMAPYLAVVGAAIAFFKELFKNTEPLKLAITLDVNAHIEGEAFTWSSVHEWQFFLPGRFDIKEALQSALPRYDPGIANSLIPRYERPLGLFGYAANPRGHRVRLLRRDPEGGWESASALGHLALKGPVFLFPYDGSKLEMAGQPGPDNYAPMPGQHLEEIDLQPKPLPAYTTAVPPVIFNRYSALRWPFSVAGSGSRVYYSIELREKAEVFSLDYHNDTYDCPWRRARQYHANLELGDVAAAMSKPCIEFDMLGDVKPTMPQAGLALRQAPVVSKAFRIWGVLSVDEILDTLYQFEAFIPNQPQPAFDKDMLWPVENIIVYWKLDYIVLDREGREVQRQLTLWSAPDIMLEQQLCRYNGAAGATSDPMVGRRLIFRQKVAGSRSYTVRSAICLD